MIEFVGYCIRCERVVYCENGFLNGVYQDRKLFCEHCIDH